MLFTKTVTALLVAIAAVATPTFANTCTKDKCYKAVAGSGAARSDCSSYLRAYVTPCAETRTRTITITHTTTASPYSTQTITETDYDSVVLTETKTETQTFTVTKVCPLSFDFPCPQIDKGCRRTAHALLSLTQETRLLFQLLQRRRLLALA